MISDYRCVYCLIKSYGNRLEKSEIPPTAKERFTREMLSILNDKWYGKTAPECARDIQGIYRSVINDDDPYREIKRESNDTVLEMYEELEGLIRNSDDPFDTAVRLAISGNIIDFAVHDEWVVSGI